MTDIKVFLFYLAVINIFTLSLFGVDKFKARHGAWRISENMLLTFSAVGGSAGALLGMRIFHHKTRKFRFRFGIPVMFCIHIALLLWFKSHYSI